MKYLAIVSLFGIVGAALLYNAARTDAAMEEMSNCIAHEARAAGFAGSIYSSEAWQTFAPLCVK